LAQAWIDLNREIDQKVLIWFQESHHSHTNQKIAGFKNKQHRDRQIVDLTVKKQSAAKQTRTCTYRTKITESQPFKYHDLTAKMKV
jgi:hypothetical protein